MKLAAGLAAALVAYGTVSAPAVRAQVSADPFKDKLIERAKQFGMEVGPDAFQMPQGSTQGVVAQDSLEVVQETINFQYGEMDTRLETFRKVIYARRRKKKKPVPVVVETGRTNADRVKKKQIKYVVIHSSLGSYDGAIDYLLKRPQAAHFMVGADGRVAVMVDIDDVANHLKNDEIEAQSVGIETETGILQKPYFVEADWDPEARWRMYASLAWLIRGIYYETGGANGGVPRDRAHIITHEEADRGIPGAHIDPGPHFDTWQYSAFARRFPGDVVTPREFLMRLIKDDTPPRLATVAAASGMLARVEAVDREGYGLSRMRIWKLEGGKKGALTDSWEAPAYGLPPASTALPYPTAPGDYFVEAEDLVRNRTSANLRVEPSAPSGQPLARVGELRVLDEGGAALGAAD